MPTKTCNSAVAILEADTLLPVNISLQFMYPSLT